MSTTITQTPPRRTAHQHAAVRAAARASLRRVVYHTGCPVRLPGRAASRDLVEMVRATMGELVGLSPDLEIVYGTEGVPADLSCDAPLIQRLRREFPRLSIV
ncbi:MAG: hypothetical protein KDB53_21005, partial [Planctomycetes bacterium]|nr:hypothetical protein [Planctomycetota bacterium]